MTPEPLAGVRLRSDLDRVRRRVVSRRSYATTTVPIVWPDGTLIGFMLRVGHQWFGPYVTVRGAAVT